MQCSSKRRLGLFVQMIRYLSWFSFKDIYSRKKLFILVYMVIHVHKILNCIVSNTVVKVSCSCCEGNLNMAWSSSFKMVLSKKWHNSNWSRFHFSCSLTDGSKQKIKMKTEYHGIFISFKSQLKQVSSILLFWLTEFSIICPWLGKVEVLPITPTW